MLKKAALVATSLVLGYVMGALGMIWWAVSTIQENIDD